MPMLENLPVPDFSAAATGGITFKLSDHAGKLLVIYFYPKDDTPGCTTEGAAFRDLHGEFQALNCSIFGVSRDSIASHEKFKAKMSFPFALISDPDEAVCNMFGVMKNKNMYGKQVRGVERSTFVLGPDRTLLREWRGVKVPGHVDEVLQYVQSL
jgi:peroxiredoxin Q/BCP